MNVCYDSFYVELVITHVCCEKFPYTYIQLYSVTGLATCICNECHHIHVHMYMYMYVHVCLYVHIL